MEVASASITKKPPNRDRRGRELRPLPRLRPTTPERAFERDVEGAETGPHCGRPFARVQLTSYSVGLERYDRLTDEVREAFVSGYRTETDEIRRFRPKALAVLVVHYFTLLYLYLVIA